MGQSSLAGRLGVVCACLAGTAAQRGWPGVGLWVTQNKWMTQICGCQRGWHLGSAWLACFVVISRSGNSEGRYSPKKGTLTEWRYVGGVAAVLLAAWRYCISSGADVLKKSCLVHIWRCPRMRNRICFPTHHPRARQRCARCRWLGADLSIGSCNAPAVW